MALLILFLLSGVFGYIKEGSIYELIGDDFKSFHVDFNHKIRVISFYMFSFMEPQRFNGIYFKTAKKATNTSLPIVFGKVDKLNPKNRELLSEFNVPDHPFLIYYLANSTKPYTYLGSKTEQGILSYFSSKVHKIHTFSEVEELKDSIMANFYTDGLLLGVFNENDETREKFLQFSYDNINKYQFAIMPYKAEMLEEMNIKGPAIVACRAPGLISFQDDYYKTLTNFTNLDLDEWTRKYFHPKITHLTKDRESSLRTAFPLVTLFMNMSDITVLSRFVDKITLHSKQYFDENWDKRKFIYAISDKEEYLDELTEYGLENEFMVYIIKSSHDLYVIDEDVYYGDGGFTEVGLRKFHRDYLGRDCKPFVKSEKNIKVVENEVFVANGKNFEEIVLNRKEDQLVYVYKTPFQVSIIEKLAKTHKIQVVKINQNLNHIPSVYTFQNTENLYFAEKNQKSNPIRYTGLWVYEEIIEFIKEQSPRTDL